VVVVPPAVHTLPVDQAFAQFLASAGRGGAEDGSVLSGDIYRRLKVLARAMARGRANATMSPTALVNEAWLRVAAGSQTVPIEHRAFCVYAAKVMRSVLIDYARQRKAKKRGGGVGIRLDEACLLVTDGAATVDLLDLDAALAALATADPRAARVVELRYFGGLSEQEVADELGVSVATAARDWCVARAWLRRHLSGASVG
jgi:RNA polymerase sigma factor (TIGR02999 family)